MKLFRAYTYKGVIFVVSYVKIYVPPIFLGQACHNPLDKIYIKVFQNYYNQSLKSKNKFFFLLDLECFSYVLII